MLDFNNRFGGSSSTAPAAGATGTRRDLPKANIWLNIGYIVGVQVTDAEGTRDEDRFVSLPVGIPLDTMEPITINSRNEDFAKFQSARNDLLDQLKAAGEKLAPGEERIVSLCSTTGLAVQMRRVNDPVAAPAADESNGYAVKLGL